MNEWMTNPKNSECSESGYIVGWLIYYDNDDKYS